MLDKEFLQEIKAKYPPLPNTSYSNQMHSDILVIADGAMELVDEVDRLKKVEANLSNNIMGLATQLEAVKKMVPQERLVEPMAEAKRRGRPRKDA